MILLGIALLLVMRRGGVDRPPGRRIALFLPGFGRILDGNVLRGWIDAAIAALALAAIVIRVKLGFIFA